MYCVPSRLMFFQGFKMLRFSLVPDVESRPLQGGCHCGRYRYIIDRPPTTNEIAHVMFDSTRLHSRDYNSPIPAYLRVPLAWYSGSAHPQFPNEHRRDIQRYFSPEDESVRRNFCGYCGTPLSFWDWHDHQGDFIQIALSTLRSQDLHELDDLGYIETSDPESNDNNESSDRGAGSSKQSRHSTGMVNVSHSSVAAAGPLGIPWFDSMLSRHHGVKRDSGSTISPDGTLVLWEVVEWTQDAQDSPSSSSSSPGKRKRTEFQSSEHPSKR